MKVHSRNSGIRFEHEGNIYSLVICQLKRDGIWEFQISLGAFYYAMAFVMFLLNVGINTEEVDFHTRNIICIIADDAYHVPIIYNGPSKSDLHNDTCLVRNTRYFINGCRLYISNKVTQYWIQ